jgi:hypothetical protein
MTSKRWDIEIEQGTTFARTIAITLDGGVVVLTGFDALWQLRSESGDLIISLTDTDGLTLHNTLGTIELVIDSADTALFSFTTAVHDLKLTDPSGNVLPRLRGTARLVEAVSA